MSDQKWETFIFSDFVEINPSVKLTGSRSFSFVEMKDLNDGQRFVYPSSEREISGGARFQEGDTLFARITPCLENGKICQVKGLKNGIGFGSTEFLVFRGIDGVSDNDFVYYLSRLSFVRRFAEQNMIGTSGRQRVNREAFDNLILELPPLPTQRRIAAILTALDDKIELNRRMNETLEGVAQAIWGEWFGKYAGGEEALPVGWRWGKLGEVVEAKGGTTPSTKEPEFWDGDIAWTSPKDLSNLRFPVLFETEKKITGRGLKQISSGLLPQGTLLLSSRAPIGYLAITQIPVAINQGYIAINATKDISNLYLLFWLQANMDKVIERANGSTFLEISKSNFREIEILLPPIEKHDEFLNTVELIFQKIVENEMQSKSLSKLRDSLLPRLMQGEIEL